VRRILAFIVFTFAAAGCSQQPVKEPSAIEGPTQSQYAAIVKRFTVKTNQYSGFYQTFQADMTILTTEMQTAALRQKGSFLQWDQKEYQTEREKMLQECSAYSKFFMRFYSPERDYDDLHKGKSVWKVYLDFSGQRFEGKVKKSPEKYIELKTEFPYLDRFSTPYEITFNVPMSTIEKAEAKVTLTSSLGSAEFVFPGSK
jgi:hypothetical protein